MKKRSIISLVLCLLLLTSVLFPPVSAEETTDISVENGCHSVDGKMPLLGSAQLIENGQACVLFENVSDTIMYAWNADEPVYPASLVKIMTAWLAVEQGTMTDAVTVSAGAIASLPQGIISISLQPNEVISVESLLYGLLLGSANDAAVVLAEHIAGSEAAFVAMMNERAQELGCTGTAFTDCHGLDGSQRSTARDIARILAAAMENEQFRTIFTTTNFTVPATNLSGTRYLVTGNYLMDSESLLYYDGRVTGGRTGVNATGERCIAVTAESGNMELISVIINASDTLASDGYSIGIVGGYHETTELLDNAAGYRVAQVIYDGQALKQIQIEQADSDLVIGPKVSVSTVLPEGAKISELTYRYFDVTDAMRVPVEKDALVSRVEVWHGALPVAQVDLFAMNSVRSAVINDLPEDENAPSVVSKILKVLLIVVVVIVLGILILRLIARLRMRAARKRSRHNRMSRRRSR